MKKKFFSILFALVLAVSLCTVMAVPVAAADSGSSEVVFETWDGGGLGNWSLDGPAGYSGSYSVNITGPMIVKVAYGETLQTFADVTTKVVDTHTVWDIKWTIYDTGGLYLHAKIYLDTTLNGAADTVLTGGFGATDPARDVDIWVDAYMRTGTAWQIEGYDGIDYTNDPTVGGVSYTTSASSGPTLSTLLADGTSGATWAAATVVHLAYGYVTGTEAYVDDITVDDVVYELEPRVINIDTDECFNTIQDAIDDASPGDIISVAAGTYEENIVVDIEGLTIQAASSPVIDGGGMLGPGVEITADDVTFRGFTITDFTCTPASGMGAIWVKAGGAIIDDNIIYDIRTQGDPIENPAGIGIAVWTQSGAHTDIRITNNVVHDVGSIGIRVRDNYEEAEKLTAVQDVLVEGNKVYNCGNSNILIAGFVEGVTVRDNEIYDSILPNRYGIRVIIGATDITIEDNYIHDNLRNIVLAGTDNVTIVDNTIEDTAAGSINIYITNNYNLDNTQPWNIGSLTVNTLSTNIEITSNNITDAGYGVRIENFGAASPGPMAATTTINFNNISGNTEYGVENAIATSVDAENNWWGNASGPVPATPPPGYDSYGDAVSTKVDPQPWLLEEVTEAVPEPPTFDKTLALKDKWTLVSTDKEVAAGTAWVGTTAFDDDSTIVAYKYTAGPSGGYTQVTLATQLTSVDAYYLKTSGGGGVGINYSTTGAPGVVTKTLGAGWNIISCAAETDAYTLLSQLRYVQVGEQQGTGLTSLVGQGNYNQYLATTISITLVTDAEWTAIATTPVTLNAFDGYWVQMNAGKSFGVIPD